MRSSWTILTSTLLFLSTRAESLSIGIASRKRMPSNPKARGREPHRLDVASLLAHVGAAICASAEVLEDVHGIGHGHGMLLLGGSKLCREVNLLRESVDDESKELQEAGYSSSSRWMWPLKPFAILFRLLSAKLFAAALAFAALGAAFVEVMENSRPGGHHGAVFLALNELSELLAASGVARGRFREVLENQIAHLVVLIGATGFALFETVESFGSGKIRAHHGVVILAMSNTFRVIGLLRSQIAKKDKDE